MGIWDKIRISLRKWGGLKLILKMGSPFYHLSTSNNSDNVIKWQENVQNVVDLA